MKEIALLLKFEFLEDFTVFVLVDKKEARVPRMVFGNQLTKARKSRAKSIGRL